MSKKPFVTFTLTDIGTLGAGKPWALQLVTSDNEFVSNVKQFETEQAARDFAAGYDAVEVNLK